MSTSWVLRLFAKIDSESGACWLWTGAKTWNGYGLFGVGGLVQLAHRVVYELLEGPIPKGLTLDHRCRVSPCTNPAHLEPVTMRQNILRGSGITAREARQTHCKHGHPFDEVNTRWRPTGGRDCAICRRQRGRYHMAEHRFLTKTLPRRLRERGLVWT